MRSFSDLDAFCAHLGTLKSKVEKAQRRELQHVSKMLKDDVKSQFGHYQEPVGPFPGWQELADATKERRSKAGHSENDPLLIDGTLRDSVHYSTESDKAVIGSNSDIAVYQELGTPGAKNPIPARPFLGPAAFRHSQAIAEGMGKAIAEALADNTHTSLTEGEDK